MDSLEIINRYRAGKSAYQLAKELGVSSNRIYKILKENGVNRRSQKECHNKYTIDENTLDHIDTPMKAYYLGWFASDGYNNVKNGVLSIRIIEEDVKVLEAFKELFKYSGPIRKINKKGNRKNQAGLIFKSWKISKRLLELGYCNKKTYNLKFPNFLNRELIPYFLRGFFEGDGSIWHYKKTNKISLGFIGSDSFIYDLGNFFQKELHVNSYIRDCSRKTRGIKCLDVSGSQQSQVVMAFLYSDNNFFLERKYFKYLDILKDYGANKKHEHVKAYRFSKNGKEIEIYNLRKFCIENKLSQSCMYSVYHRKSGYNSCYGYTSLK